MKKILTIQQKLIKGTKYWSNQFIHNTYRFCSSIDLRNVLQNELDEELQRTDKKPLPALPSGWEIFHKTGMSTFSMKKRTEKGELLVLHSKIISKSDENTSIPFSVTVEKNGKGLNFSLAANGELVLENITSITDSKTLRLITEDTEAPELFNGPDLSELNDTVMQSFLSYLDQLGINDSLAEFIEDYCFAIEQDEYENWLSDIIKFTS